MGMTADVETWSGQITEAQYQPQWVEYYEYAVYRTEWYSVSDSDGKGSHMESRQVFDHWEPTTETHPRRWFKYDTFGRTFSISEAEYVQILGKFGRRDTRPGVRSTYEHNSHMLSGDPNDYYAVNATGYIFPVTDVRHWSNRVKASPSAFSFPQVPLDAPVYEYPKNKNPFASDRLLGTAKGAVSTLAWDQMNARLGPTKKVNVILVGYGDKDSSVAELQKSKWIGGKKNDIVVCYGGDADPHKARWAKVFGWSDSDICKYEVQTVLLQNPVDDSIIPKIEKEIWRGYVIKDWHQFDYLTVEPPRWSYWVYLLAVVVTQGLVWILGTLVILGKFDFWGLIPRKHSYGLPFGRTCASRQVFDYTRGVFR